MTHQANFSTHSAGRATRRTPRSRRICLFLTLLVLAGSAAGKDLSFKVVVNETNATRSLTREQLSRLFLKKVSRWDDGQRVQPVDLEAKSELRERFNNDVHQRSTTAIESYWRKLIFSGRSTPPRELSSAEEVMAFVRENSRAIGYLPAGTQVGDGVRVVEIVD